MNTCQCKSQLTAFLLGDLPEHESAALQAHLELCQECRATAEELRGTLALLRDVLSPGEGMNLGPRLDDARRQRLLAIRPVRVSKRISRWFFAVHPAFRAAAAVLVVGLGLFAVISAALFPAVSNSARKARLTSQACAVKTDYEVMAGRSCSAELKSSKQEENLDYRGQPGKGSDKKMRKDSDAPMAQPAEAAATRLSVAEPPLPPPSDSAVGEKAKRLLGGDRYGDAYGGRDGAERATREARSGVPPVGKVRLDIALPKPQFTGTPKAIQSPNLETAQERLKEGSQALGLGRGSSAKEPAAPAQPRKPVVEKEVSEAEPAKKKASKTAFEIGRRQNETATDEFFAENKPAEPRAPVFQRFHPFVASATEPFSTFAMDVDTASYTLTRQAIRSGAMPDPERVRTEEIVNAFDYGDTAPERTVFRIYQEGSQSPFGAGYHLLRIGVKGRRLGREEQRPAMLTFVIDTSGSMAQPDRIGLARMALALLLEQLTERDRIQIIAYSDHARLILEPVGASKKGQVMDVFDRLQCNGSTNLEEGLRQAYEQAARGFVPGAENRVILISDGVANLGSDSALEILDKVASFRKQGITCSVFGVGAGTYNDRMLEELANKGDGVYRFLDSAEEVRTAFVDDLAATLNTVAKDAKIQVEWNPEVVRQYRQLGYENRALTKEQFRDDAVDAGEVGSGQSVTALYELELASGVAPTSLLGTVRIRYRRTDTGKSEEIETPLPAESVLRPAHKASAHFRVAACAAEFAEQLRGSPHAAGGRFQDVADYLRPAALELALDTRVKELLELILAMDAMKR